MTEAELARQLADEIDAELNELRRRFTGRGNDHFSFGLKFSSWGVIVTALRAYSTPVSTDEGLMDAVATTVEPLLRDAVNETAAMLVDWILTDHAHLIADFTTQGFVALERHAFRQQSRSQTSRLEHHHFAGAGVSAVEHDLRHLGRFS